MFVLFWIGLCVVIIDSVYCLVDFEIDVEFDLVVVDVNGI